MGKDTRLVYSTETGDLRKKPEPKPEPGNVTGPAKGGAPVTVRLDTKARRGKAVTIISNIPHNPQVIADLARPLRNLCGAGGTVEGKDILIQGDHRDKVISRLTALGYKPVRK